jgi:ribosomal protein S18 acetylase RimI-like enzyme
MTDSIQMQILKTLQNSKSGLQMEEVGEKLGFTRHTVAKYLEVLRAEGKVHYNQIGRTKVWSEVSASINIRFLGMDDLEEVVRIQEKIIGEQNSDKSERLVSLRDTTAHHLQNGDPLLNLGAEVDGKLIGFIISEVRRWEFGGGGMTGWILILGVDREYRGIGAGHKLSSTLIDHFHRKGITKIRTMVEWHEGELISYFRSLGFNMLGMLPLEKEV